MMSLDSAFSPLAVLLNVLYSRHFSHKSSFPPFTIMRLMLTLWRRHVFSHVSDLLINGAVSLFSKIRDENLKNKDHAVEYNERLVLMLTK
jgi:hypothetical protein